MSRPATVVGVTGVLSGTLVWGLVWFPYRYLDGAGLGGASATLATFSIALLMGLALFPRYVRGPVDGWLLALGLACGVTNLSYVLAVIDGVVVRVMLLFYLSPIWTLAFARLLLGERPGAKGLAVVGLSMSGAFVMLWQPSLGLPLPRNGSEWLAALAGVSFALVNVLGRRLAVVPAERRGLVMWAGVVLTAMAVAPLGELSALARFDVAGWAVVALVAMAMMGVAVSVQYGVSLIPANRAAVLFLLELVFAALSAWWFAGEAIGWREWAGGAMIVAGALVAAREVI